tara:strand:+ start:386 stop:661 length:276 start_codon:yes stop_codon:yes gene_type:complete
MKGVVGVLMRQSMESLRYVMGKNPKSQAEQNKLQDEYHRMKGYPKPLMRFSPVQGFNPAGGYNEKKRVTQVKSTNRSNLKIKRRSLMNRAS